MFHASSLRGFASTRYTAEQLEHVLFVCPARGKRNIKTGKGEIHEKSIDHLGDTGAADLRGRRSPGGDLSALFAGPELVRVVSEMPCGLLQFMLFRVGAADRETHLFLLHPHLPEMRIFQMQKAQVKIGLRADVIRRKKQKGGIYRKIMICYRYAGSGQNQPSVVATGDSAVI